MRSKPDAAPSSTHRYVFRSRKSKTEPKAAPLPQKSQPKRPKRAKAEPPAKRQKLIHVEPPVEKTSQASIACLPDSLLAMVFKQLEARERIRVERVSRRWAYVSRNFSWTLQHSICKQMICLNKTSELSLPWLEKSREEKQHLVLKRIGDMLARGGRYVKEMDLSRMGTFMNYSVCNILKQTPQLTLLNLEGIQMTNSTLSNVGYTLPNLLSLSLRNCFHATQLERGLATLLESCRSLHSLDLSGNMHFFGEKCLTYLPGTLRSLNLNNCHQLHSAAVAAIGERCGGLVELQMDQVDVVSPQDVNRLFERLPCLEVLQYRYRFYHNHTTTNMPHLMGLGELRRLKKLLVNDNGMITDMSLKAVGHGCKALEHVDISGCHRHITDVGMRHLANLPLLTHLSLREMRHLTDETVEEISRHGTLVELNVRRCSKLTDQSISAVLERCRQLQRLDVSHCPNVTNASLKKLKELLDAQHGKTKPDKAQGHTRFHLQAHNSGIKSGKELKHPWLKVKDGNDDYFQMYLGQFLPFALGPQPALIHAIQMFP